jgi:hypothetical protein
MVILLRSFLSKVQGALEADKTNNFFNYGQMEGAARAALHCLATNMQRQRISSCLPNLGAAFCNKGAKDGVNSALKRDARQAHMLLLHDPKLVSVTELHMHNGLYDLLVIVRDANGIFSYRAQLMCSIEQIMHFLKEQQESEGKSKSKSKSELSQHSASLVRPEIPEIPEGPEKPIPNPGPLVCAKPVSQICLSADESSVVLFSGSLATTGHREPPRLVC